MHGYHLFFGKLDMLDELAQKGRAAIDAVTALALLDDESCLAKEVKIIIDIPGRKPQHVANLSHGVASALCQQQQETQLLFQFIVTHGF
jgi:hypothetical protein